MCSKLTNHKNDEIKDFLTVIFEKKKVSILLETGGFSYFIIDADTLLRVKISRVKTLQIFTALFFNLGYQYDFR